jgi:hypothetical protein
MSSLEERLDSFPEAWKPDAPGEKLIGELTDVDLRESEYGDPYPILTVLSEADGKEWAWHAFHTMARNAVAKKKPQIGERVGIVYAGVGEAQPGMNAPVRWRLLVERPKQQVDYAAVATGTDEAAAAADDDVPF